MRTVVPATALVCAIWMVVSASVFANDGNAIGQCKMITTPYRAEQFPTCSAKIAAAYDFAFCGVYYLYSSVSFPDPDKLLGQNSPSAKFRRTAEIYLGLSQLLSDEETAKNNVTFAKEYFLDLGENKDLASEKIRYVQSKCSGIEGWHSQVVNELINVMQRGNKKAD